MNQPSYIFNKSEDQPERDRLKLIERYHDPRTRERLQQVGISAKGTCLEVGPGAGSIMRWMARIVGPQGHVMAFEPRNGSWITKVRTSSWRTWQNKKMSYHHQGDYDFFYFTRHTNIFHGFFAPNCRF